jgi:predicted DNA-binding transcriptional regulator AlpA
VSTSQVDEWIRLGPSIRFPAPFKWASGIPSWQLAVIDQWYELWKASNGG